MCVAKVDLHLHTNWSDGAHPPAEVMAMAAQAGLRVVSVTDHDTVAGIPEARAAAAKLGLIFLPGIEISTRAEGTQHLLGYLFDPDHPAMQAICNRFSEMRRTRIAWALAFLAKRGIRLTLQEVRETAGCDQLGRPHVAAAMVKAGYAESIQEAFQNHLGTVDYYREERPKPPASEGISAIRAAGGVAVLAHPHSLGQEPEVLARTVGALKEMGISGMECHYGTYGAEETQRYERLAKRLGLVVTGGSDFHGLAVKPHINIGSGEDGRFQFGDLAVVEKLKAAAGSCPVGP